MKYIFAIVICFLIACKPTENISCEPKQKCWCHDELLKEWYRLVDWRENMEYLAAESPDSTMREESKRISYRLSARIAQVELMLNEIK